MRCHSFSFSLPSLVLSLTGNPQKKLHVNVQLIKYFFWIESSGDIMKAKKLPSGNWRVRLYVGKEDGKPKYKSFTASTKKEAEFAAAQYGQQKRHEADP